MINTIVPANWQVPKHIKAFVTTNVGGVSKNNYHSMNLGTHVGDSIDDVVENRKRLHSIIGTNKKLLWLNQIHSDIVINSTNYTGIIDADASISSDAFNACIVMTADCLPVLITNKSGTQIAALHCGWKGLYQQLITKTITKFINTEPSDFIVWFGPAISKQNYEVDNDLYERFINKNKAYKEAFTHNRVGHYLCDLAKIAEIELLALNITTIFKSELCTFEDERFFSYRQNNITGRIVSVIYIDN